MWLILHSNNLTGEIPPELGNLDTLELLWFGGNDLTGRIPAELGNLVNLRKLSFWNNSGLTGALPLSFTALRDLEEINLGGTGLCMPNDKAFQDWLAEQDQVGAGPNCDP